MDNKKQYYNNLKPGDTSIESRLGAKILMNDNLVINASRRSEYLDQLREDEYQGNINPNADEETSIVFMGKIPVDINQQGNINQESILENRESTITTPNRTPGEMPDEEQFDPPTITNVTPLEGRKGDTIIIEGTGFINNSTQVYFGGVLADSVDFVSPTKIIAYVGNGNSGDIIVKASGISSAPYKDKFNYLGVEEGVMYEEEPADQLDSESNFEGEIISDPDKKADETAANTPKGCEGTGPGHPPPGNLRKITDKPSKPSQCFVVNSQNKISPTYDFIAAAKLAIGTYTKFMAGGDGGNKGCGIGLSIIYNYATGHGMTWILKKKKQPIIGTALDVLPGTYSIDSTLQADKVNFERIIIFDGKLDRNDYTTNHNWEVAKRLIQPGDIINTRTNCTGCKSGHIGLVVDTKDNNGKDFDIISNSSGGYRGGDGIKTPAGAIAKNFTVGSWYSKVAIRTGVGPTIIYRFKCGRGAEWGKTISIPNK
jgi:hypothetical protein